jgi:predicted phage terminase large subunit-like protein
MLAIKSSDYQLISDDLIDKELARRNLLDFNKYTFENYECNWHHKVLCEKLTKFALDPKCNRLIVEMPPQHGKSEHISVRLVCFLLGINPDLKVVNTGYNLDHIKKYNVQSQRLISSPKYQAVFPNTKLRSMVDKNNFSNKGKFVENQNIFEIVQHKGSYKCVGVGGALTGSPADIAIVDDPFKDYEEARSQNRRDLVWNWYNSVFCSRLHSKSKIIIVQTRWHEDDLIGRVLNSNSTEKWDVLTLRAIKEEKDDFPYDKRKTGQALWPNRFDLELLNNARLRDNKTFVSLYQQKPAPDEGTIFKKDTFQFYPIAWDKQFKVTMSCLSVDAAFKDLNTSDFVVIQYWVATSCDKIIKIDTCKAKLSFTKTIEKIKEFNTKYKPKALLIEDKANGPAIIDSLKTNLKNTNIIPINPKASKESRAWSVTPMFDARKIYFPQNSPWIDDYTNELLSFPNAKHDDQVDATTQALNYLKSKKILEIVY